MASDTHPGTATPSGAPDVRPLPRRLLSWGYRQVSRAYMALLARPSGQPLNDAILHLALRARGYNNFSDPRATGEDHFIDLLASTSPTLCVDVGANRGAYSAALLTRTNARVIAFEPLPGAFEALSTLASRHPGRLQAVNMGVGARCETLTLHHGTDDSELASFSPEVQGLDYVGRHNVHALDVPVVTLDSYFAGPEGAGVEAIDLLKIDTEGFEYEVLLGARETLARLRPRFVQIEYNWHQLFRDCSLRKLAGLLPGYVAYQLLPHGGGMVRRDVDRPESNIPYFSNFVFVRADRPLP
jgi:FkbM family methyltransferase